MDRCYWLALKLKPLQGSYCFFICGFIFLNLEAVLI